MPMSARSPAATARSLRGPNGSRHVSRGFNATVTLGAHSPGDEGESKPLGTGTEVGPIPGRRRGGNHEKMEPDCQGTRLLRGCPRLLGRWFIVIRRVQQFIISILKANGQTAGHAPHKDFWATLSYPDFVTGPVPNVSDPVTGDPMPILVKGDSAKSNLILALRGAKGTVFDPDTGAFGQMPANGPPFFTDDQINSIAAWIDAGCPQ